MSNQALAWAFGLSLGSAAQKAVLLYLADRAQEDGSCAWPSVMRIRVATELSERSVRAALKALCERGLIVPGDQRHAALGRNNTVVPRNRRSRVWDLCMDVPVESFDGVQCSADVERRLRGEEGAERAPGHRGGDDVPTDAPTDGSAGGGGSAPVGAGVGCTSCTPDGGGADRVGCRSCMSRGAGAAPKPKTKPINPSAPTGHLPASGAIPSDGGSGMSGDGHGPHPTRDPDTGSDGGSVDRVLDALAERRRGLGLTVREPSKADRRAVGRLLERLRSQGDVDPAGVVLSVLDTAFAGTWWPRLVRDGRGLESRWERLVDDVALDARHARAAGDSGHGPAVAAHVHAAGCEHVRHVLASPEAVGVEPRQELRMVHARRVADELNRREGRQDGVYFATVVLVGLLRDDVRARRAEYEARRAERERAEREVLREVAELRERNGGSMLDAGLRRPAGGGAR